MIEKFNFTSKAKTIFIAIGAIGLALIIIGMMSGKAEHTRFWANFLLCNFYFLSFSVIAVAWMSIQYLAKASWATVLKRIVEAISGYMIVGIAATVVMFLFSFVMMDGQKMGEYSIYSWLHIERPEILNDRILSGKRVLLNFWSFNIATFVLLGVWYYARQKYRSASMREDREGGLEFYNKQSKYSAAFLPFFGLSICLFNFLWLMSTEPKWFSTMYAVNIFIGGLVSTITIIALIAFILKRNNYLNQVNANHFHDLGKFMFGFSIFWMYTWLAQFLLIWYANMNDEIVYFLARMHGKWAILFWSNIIINFLLPFLGLMMRDAKRKYSYLIFVGCIMLVGRYVDWYLAIMPGTAGNAGQAGFGFLEIGFFMLFAGMFAYTVAYKLSKANLLASNHPFLEESFHHEI